MKRESQRNPSLMTLLGAATLGALTMYISDPDRGKRRRALAADKTRRLAHKTGDMFNVASRDFNNRVQGLRAQAGRLFSRREKQVDDEVLVARVRKEIGRAISHPRAIKVTAQQGSIALFGPILASEKEQLLACIRSVPGVSDLQDNLEVHETAEHIPSLQGEGKHRQSIAQDNWTPTMRAIATVGGGALGMYGVVRRSPASVVAAMIGLGLMTRGIANKPFTQMGFGGAKGQAINLHKTIHIAAAPETVFDIWSNYQNFPHFMSNVQEVRDLGNGRSHWVVRGPAGFPVGWEATMSQSVRPELLAWTSEPGASVQNSGTIRFEPEGDGTRVSIHIGYSPPAGALGHAVASLFNDNPKQQMDQDLMRMKMFIESGTPPRDAAQPMRQKGAAPLH
jgi:uncharacterized membrane protein